jgi:hypothetical protein
MTTKTEAEKALEEREKALAQREKELDAREKAAAAPAVEEDTTPYPTQAMNDARARGEWDGDPATYKTRETKAG